MALGNGPLRTKELTERVRGYTPRTVYRYANRLTELGVVERQEEPGVPSKVVHSLTRPCGRELHDLVEAYAAASLTRLPNGEIDAHAWGSLALLADLWEAGMIEELNRGPRSPTELSRGPHGLSYHQVSRRASLFAIGGLIQELPDDNRRRRYALTERTRRAMALIAAIGRWRGRHFVPEGSSGLSVAEGAGLLRTAMPLVALPEHKGKSFAIEILAVAAPRGEESEMVWGRIGPDGRVLNCGEPLTDVGARGRGKVIAWIDAIVDGSSRGLRTEGEDLLIGTLLQRLHAVLWTSAEPEQPPPAPVPAEPGS
ncbi:MAG: winged helix-turn-helix transcriptional regulator [Solirubrobacterales bacterium]